MCVRVWFFLFLLLFRLRMYSAKRRKKKNHPRQGHPSFHSGQVLKEESSIMDKVMMLLHSTNARLVVLSGALNYLFIIGLLP